jgi:hypothetical protein
MGTMKLVNDKELQGPQVEVDQDFGNSTGLHQRYRTPFSWVQLLSVEARSRRRNMSIPEESRASSRHHKRLEQMFGLQVKTARVSEECTISLLRKRRGFYGFV